MLCGAQRRNRELCRPNHSLSSARRFRRTPNRSPRSSRTTSRPAWRRSRRSRRPPRTGAGGSASWPRGTCPSWWPRSGWPGTGWVGVGGGGGGGFVCGFAYASPWRPKSAYRHTVEDTVYLSPGCTGRGIGSALLGTLLAGCAAAGARQVIAVIADTGSDASAALHRRFGFARAGLLSGVGRKHGLWIDTLLMQKELESRGPTR